MDAITDPQVLASIREDGRKLIIILATCLGAMTYSALSSFVFDLFLIRSLFEGRRCPNFFQALTRLTYFLSRVTGLVYFIAGLLISTKGMNCSSVTRCHQVSFYLLQVNNHWLFASRNLATWRTHKKFAFVFVYSVSGMLVMIFFGALCIWDGKIGHVVEPIGCIYTLNDQTRPRMSFALPLLFFGILFHSVNMILAAIRFAGLAKSSRSQSHSQTSWWKWPVRVIAVRVPRGLSGAKEDVRQPDVLADLLIRHGMHYWILCLIAAIVLVAVPTLMHVNSWHFSAGILLYAFFDTEMGSRIFRDTVILAQSARPAPSGSTSSSGSNPMTGTGSAKSPSKSSPNWATSPRQGHGSYLRQTSRDEAPFPRDDLTSPRRPNSADEAINFSPNFISRQTGFTTPLVRRDQDLDQDQERELNSGAFLMSPILPQAFRR